MTELKPCPCGETPTKLGIDGTGRSKWAFVYGNCCSEWHIEFRTNYALPNSDECMKLGIYAWNDAPRNTRIEDKT